MQIRATARIMITRMMVLNGSVIGMLFSAQVNTQKIIAAMINQTTTPTSD